MAFRKPIIAIGTIIVQIALKSVRTDRLRHSGTKIDQLLDSSNDVFWSYDGYLFQRKTLVRRNTIVSGWAYGVYQIIVDI